MFKIQSDSNLNSCFTFKLFKTCHICEKNIYMNQKTLDCGHFFHNRCIKSWVLSYKSCPICRRKFQFRQKKTDYQLIKSFTPYAVCSFR